jgi:TRAP-type C4-dicarboxylate transport system permease small subunit
MALQESVRLTWTAKMDTGTATQESNDPAFSSKNPAVGVLTQTAPAQDQPCGTNFKKTVRHRILNLLRTFSRISSRLLFVIAGLALVSSMFLTCGDVILRCFKAPIVGTYELVGILGALVIGFAVPQTSRVRGQVVMDFLTDKLPYKLRIVLHVVTRFIGIALFAIIAWQIWNLGNDYRTAGEVTLTLQIPTYPVAYAISLCSAIQCLVLFVDIFETKDLRK